MSGSKKFVAVLMTVILAVSITGFAFANDDETQVLEANDTTENIVAANDADGQADVAVATSDDVTTPVVTLAQDASANSDEAVSNMADQAKMKGYVWFDENRNGVFDADEEGIEGVSVTVYSSTDFAATWTEGSTVATEADGSYTFADNFEPNALYYVQFENTDPAATQFTLSPNSGFSHGDSLDSHVVQWDSDNVSGTTNEFFPVDPSDDGYCYVNAGFCAFPTVTYDKGAATAAENIPGVEDARTGTEYTVQGEDSLPTWAGHFFTGWSVKDYEAGALDPEYQAGDTFYMPWTDVVLVAQWSDSPVVKPTLVGYSAEYDGNAHGVTVNNVTEDDTIEYYVEGKPVADAPEFTDASSTDVTVIVKRDGREILNDSATVEIKPLTVKVTTPSASRVYDGTPFTADGEVLVGKDTLPGNGQGIFSSESTIELVNAEGVWETGTIQMTASLLDAGSVRNSCSTLELSDNADPANYNISYAFGTLTLEKCGLIINIPSASKQYDGKPLNHTVGTLSGLAKKDEGKVTLTVKGSQTEVGSTKMTYEIVWGDGVKASNYKIQEQYVGSLVVKYGDEVVVVTSGTWVYDGLRHAPKVEVFFDGGANEMPAGYTLVEASSSFSAIDATNGPVKVQCDNLKIVDASGKDVTKELEIRQDTNSSVFTIERAVLSVSTQSASKVYDGTALTAPGSISGFVAGQTASFAVTGSQTQVGSSKNTYSLAWTDGSTNPDNYTVVETLGTLTVEAAASAPSDNGSGTDAGSGTGTGAGTGTAAITGAGTGTTGSTAAGTSDTGNPVIDAMANAAGAVTGNDVTVTITPQTSLDDEETPLAAGPLYAWNWVTLYVAAGMILTAIYGAGVVIRRRNHMAALSAYEDQVFGKGKPLSSFGKKESLI